MTELKVGAIMYGGPWDKRHESIRRVYLAEGLAPTVTAGGGGGVEPKVILFEDDFELLKKEGDNLTINSEKVFEGKPFTYVSLFSGVGGFEQALNKLGGTCVMASEIDKYANIAYEILYGHKTVGDITKVAAEDVPDHDLLVGGFPCQAFSVAGKRLGFEDTRGTLFFEVARIAKVKKPKVMLLENVKGLVSHDKGRTLDTIVQTLCDIGYTVDFEVLNSKYFGVPQNRERIFIIAIRDDLIKPEPWKIEGTNVVAKGKRRIAKLDGVKMFNFDWPPQTEVTTRLRDILEENVAEKYYLSEEKTAKLIAQLTEESLKRIDNFMIDDQGRSKKALKPLEIEPTLRRETHGNEPKIVDPILVGKLALPGKDQWNRVYSKDGVSPTLVTMQGGRQEPKIAVEQFSRGEGISCCIDANYKNGTSPGDVGKGRRTHIVEEVRPVLTPDRIKKRQNDRRFKEDGEESFTLTAQDIHGVAIGAPPRYRIRKLTPRECFRLQGFPDSEFDKLVAAGISDTQLYKMAGNAVTVNVVKAIAKRIIPLLIEK